MKKILSVCFAFMLLFSSCSAPAKKNEQPSEQPSQSDFSSKRIIASWLYYNEIEELVKKSDTENDFIVNIENAVDKLIEFSVNTLILHVRAFDDAFYKSEIFPVSKYCADNNGNLKFDVLKCFSDVCHRKGVKLWCWVNPYRINKADDISVIKEGFFQYEALNSENEQMLIRSSNGVYYNPADSQVKRHIIDGIREILENYDVDGIHFDDYFYPQTDAQIDSIYC
ncbi:MAG: family 10 glycosylhydrolase [Oscillospiraceae bacterium]|nr:family 10 glycosylhydrolase [Oscillospiraceae bacterium]